VKSKLIPIALLAGVLFARGTASAQLVVGQYEDEAPLGTWNTFGAPSAPSVGLGGTQFSWAWDVSTSLANPALLLSLPRLSASLSASYGAASMFRYALVNTGPVESTSNLSVGVLGIDHGGLAYRRGAWAFALALAAPESYGRPGIVLGGDSYQLTFEQTGYLRVLHAGVARRLPWGLSLGIGLNFAAGKLDRTTVEQSADILRIVTITDDKHETFRGLYVNAGLTWAANAEWTAALVVRTPYVKESAAESLVRYEVPVEGTDIRIDAAATNAYRQPWVAGAGLSYRIAKAWSLAAEAAWFGWSRYEATSFDEPLVRTFRDVVKAGAGIQYLARAGSSGRPPRIPLRLGFSIDPQPMAAVHSTYLRLTFGAGLEFRNIALDLSGAVGRESGSGRDLRAGRIALSCRYIFRE
jgi:hypothetical protein